MRALSIRQPWVELILRGSKDVENRTWRTHHRGPLLLHASRTVEAEAMAQHRFTSLPTGGVLGMVEIVDCTAEVSSPWHLEGCFGWYLHNPVRFEQIIRMPGRVGFFHVDEGSPQLAAALAAARRTGGGRCARLREHLTPTPPARRRSGRG